MGGLDGGRARGEREEQQAARVPLLHRLRGLGVLLVQLGRVQRRAVRHDRVRLADGQRGAQLGPLLQQLLRLGARGVGRALVRGRVGVRGRVRLRDRVRVRLRDRDRVRLRVSVWVRG